MFGRILKFLNFGLSPAKRAGVLGERAAAKFLAREKSMRILERNARIGRLEADIVALDGDCLVFVEVKTRSADAPVDGYYAAVSRRKMKNMRLFARSYIASLRRKPAAWRFDAVDVRHKDGKIVSVLHFENVR